ncbi:hypothetical protein DID88_008197 [Monilinia fructigena]|uniref:Uncharacterized protein n=1 Tax=Monilinia fructigena TaxID=38457 RepID=A0A395J4N0_9HELO|nr:hypothetical protein DID88_008197 [Monilinia fructigena]
MEAHVEEIGMVGMALGTLMVAVVGNSKILEVLQKGRCPRGTGIDLGKAMAGFVPLLIQSSPQNAQRLDVFPNTDFNDNSTGRQERASYQCRD